MNTQIMLMIEFGYFLIFGIYGLASLFLTIPKEKGIEYYKKARKALGTGLCMIAVYCMIRMFLNNIITDYIQFWLLTTFTLFHSWMTYSCLLFLLETPKYKARHFLIDGAIPISAMSILGFIGLLWPDSQNVMTILFGFTFGLKNARMIQVCYQEYVKCEKELKNYYDVVPDIAWIKRLLFVAIIMSAATLVALYVPETQLAYYLAIPIVYGYIVMRVLNFMPKKIEDIRAKNILLEKEKVVKESKTIEDKIGSKVEKWVEEKKFCQNDLTIKDVALQMGTNHNYLSSYINNNKGVTYQVWLNTLRIIESQRLLIENNGSSIEEIGIMVGIPQPYNFSRWFKIVTGTTPYQYRKHHPDRK
ncbi:MAG: helix-turn-helix transcriptional regulator [Bacteroidales bacterium]|nr:helix-turn-helix transcriptional regulator [Bacteroidales bacterium]